MGRKKKKKRKNQKELEKELSRLQRIVESFSRRSREYLIGESKYDTVRIAVVSDTHIGSLYERIDALNKFYELLKSEKINTVFHCGDLLDGHKVYRGQEYDQYALGFSKQLESLIERYPRIKGIETHFILGNHDESFKRQSGIITGKIIEQVRPDLHYLDQDVATVKLKTKSGKTVKYQLIHPSGGTTYAVSYKSQKIIESYSGGKKPDAVFIGHYHKADHMPCFRNVQAIQAGCFMSQTPYMLRKPTSAHIGGWIIEHTIGKLTNRFKTEFIAFYEK